MQTNGTKAAKWMDRSRDLQTQKQRCRRCLATWPGSRLLTWQSIAAQPGESEHRLSFVQNTMNERYQATRTTSQCPAVAVERPGLPDPPITSSNGSVSMATSRRPPNRPKDTTQPCQLSTSFGLRLRLAHSQEHQLTGAQQRQVQLIEALLSRSWASITVIDFGGAARRRSPCFTDCPKVPDRDPGRSLRPPKSSSNRAWLSPNSFSYASRPTLRISARSPTTYWQASSAPVSSQLRGAFFVSSSMLDAEFFCVDRTPVSPDGEGRTYLQRVRRERCPRMLYMARRIHCAPPPSSGFLQASISTELSSRKRVLFR